MGGWFNDSRYQEATLCSSVSMCVPAVRMVAVLSWINRDGEGEYRDNHEILPVVGLRSLVQRHYSRPRSEGEYFATFATHREMIKHGWKFKDQGVHTEVMVAYEGLLCCAFDIEPGLCSAAVFSCPWPPDEDEERLREWIQKLHREAVELDRQKSPALA